MEVEIRPSDTGASLHDIQAIQILRLVSSFDLWISRRGPGFHITRCQLDRHHEDEDRELCVEVRVFFSFFFSSDGLIRGDRLDDFSEPPTLMGK